MMKYTYTFLVFTLLACSGTYEDTSIEELNEPNLKTIDDFVPSNLEILAQDSGDINHDGIEDDVLVLRHKSEQDTSQSERRVMILLGDENHGLKLWADNPNLVYCAGCGGISGDPFEGLIVKENGEFTITHYGGSVERWSRTTSFRYSEEWNDFVLTEDYMETFNALEPDSSQLRDYFSVDLWGETKFFEYSIME